MNEENKSIDFNLSVEDLMEIIKKPIGDYIRESLSLNKNAIQDQIHAQFKKSFWGKSEDNIFEKSLDWAVEHSIRKGVDEALEELNFSEMIKEKAKEILSDGDFIKTLAEAKIREKMGL